RGTRMQPDDEERMAGDAEAETRIVRIAADIRGPGRAAARVEVVQALQLRPQHGLEAALVGIGGTVEQGYERMHGGIRRVHGFDAARERGKGVEQRRIVATVAEPPELVRLDRRARQGGLGSDAGKGRIVDEGKEAFGNAALAGPGRRRARWGDHGNAGY